MKNKIITVLAFILLAQVGTSQAQNPKDNAAVNIEKWQATNELALLKIQLADMENKPRPFETVEIQAQKQPKSYPIVTDKEGKFTILLPKGEIYSVKVAGWGSNGEEFANFELEAVEGEMEASLKLNYEPAKTFTLENVLFETGKSNLKASSFAVLDELARFLIRKINIEAEISGHTDNVGDDAANEILSAQRAKTVVDYLVKKGVAKNRLQPKGYGENQPVADNDTEANRQLNRRTELRVSKE
jgi:OmpA-OmpF porin, OOP family